MWASQFPQSVLAKTMTTTTPRHQQRQRHIVGPCHRLNATSAKRRERGGGGSGVTRGSEIPTTALAMPIPYCKPVCIGSPPSVGQCDPYRCPRYAHTVPYCKPICLGSPPVRGSVIPTAALIVPIPYCKPICMGSPPAWGSVIPTAASVAPIPSIPLF